jgi:hypothetical protein
LGDIRDTVKEQRVLSEFVELIENDIDPLNRTESGLLELVKIIHRNLSPNNLVMLAMNKIQLPAKTPKEFYVKFLTVRAEDRETFNKARELGYFKPNAQSNHSIDSSGPSSRQRKQKRRDEWRENSHSSKPLNVETCWTCGIKGHSKLDCSKSAHPDRNQEDVPFLQSAIGKRWATKFPTEPHCHHNRNVDGNPRNSPNPTAGTGKTISDLTLQHERYISSLNKASLSDFLTVTISPFRKVLLLTEAEVVEQIEEVEEVEIEVEEEADFLTAVTTVGKDIRALLDTGCLIEDCISKQVVDSINASHLLFDVTTTICSGFNNQYQDKFQCLEINLSFLNETTFSFEHFTTTVIVLKDSPINLIVGRETIKKLRLIDRLPSHFVESKNLTVLQKTQGSFADNNSEELYGYKLSNQVRTERSHPVKMHAHRCISSLNPDDETVDFDGPSVNSLSQTRKTDMTILLKIF